MRKVTLGRTQIKVSSVSLGTWAFGGANMSGKFSVGWSDQSKNNSKKTLTRAWELNINHWDTADVYGDGLSESIIGEMWDDIPRDDIIIATKVGWDKGPNSYWYDPDHMRHNLERSLKNLATDYVDIIYLHHCNFGKNEEYFDDAIQTIRRFQDEGKARFIGLSDWYPNKIMDFIDRVDPDVIQPYRNVMDDTYKESGLKRVVAKNNLGVCFFSPLKHGLLTGKYKKPMIFRAGDHRSEKKEFSDEKIIKKMENNKKELESRFSFHKNPVMYGIINYLFTGTKNACVLLGQRNVDQVETAAMLGDILPEKDYQWLKDLYST